VVIEASASIDNLRLFQRKRRFRAETGEVGRGQKRYGKNGRDAVITVPVGTVVSPKTALGDDTIIADLSEAGQRVVVARGGRGGLGNVHFASSTNQTPQIAQKGEAGESASLILELKLIADIGIIGYPNVGKSTLITAVSAAHPKIAPYPFTTLEPVLGVVERDHRSVVFAEIPGLVGEAHLGKGLGHDFLRHITRTRMLIHLVDGSAAEPVADMVRVNTELGLFDSALAKKPQIVAVNKIDLPEVQARRDEITQAFRGVAVEPLFIAAASGEGIAELLTAAFARLEELPGMAEVAAVAAAPKVFRPQPRAGGVRINYEVGVYVIEAPELQRIVERVDLEQPTVSAQIGREMERLGVNSALKKAGAAPGARLRCGTVTWDWY
jgi:GTP-binding protein